MPKYKLSAVLTIGIYTEVEANSLEEAIKISEDRKIESYHFGDKEQVYESWISDDFDGVPCKITES